MEVLFNVGCQLSVVSVQQSAKDLAGNGLLLTTENSAF
jgi:hypothetical protein